MNWDQVQEKFIQVQEELETIWIKSGDFIYPSGETLVIKEMKGVDWDGKQKTAEEN